MWNILTATETPNTNRKPTAWLQTPTKRRPHHRRHHSLVCTSCYQSRHSQNLITIFPHSINGALVQSNVTDSEYYIRSADRLNCITIMIVEVRWSVVYIFCKTAFETDVGNYPDDGGSKDLWNVGKLLPDYTALQPRRQPSSYSPPWEPQILLYFCFIRKKGLM
jgi:hypothetical protein